MVDSNDLSNYATPGESLNGPEPGQMIPECGHHRLRGSATGQIQTMALSSCAGKTSRNTLRTSKPATSIRITIILVSGVSILTKVTLSSGLKFQPLAKLIYHASKRTRGFLTNALLTNTLV